jgi:polysaccharide chain length determinant protein (PEP-CTERM system associated)
VDSPRENTSAFILGYVHAIWRRKWVAAAVCWGVCLIGWVAVFKLPDSYESDARVYLDVNSLLTPLLRGLAVEADPLHQLDYMQRTLLSRSNLEQVIHLADLDSMTKTPADKDQLLLNLSTMIKVSLQGQNLFNISYTDANPVQAKNVVAAVLNVFSESTAGNNRSQMDTARRFLEDQIAAYERQLRAAETRRAQFHEAHSDLLDSKSGESAATEAHGNLEKAGAALDDAQVRRDSLAKELAATPQYMTTKQAAQIVINTGETTRRQDIETAKRKLADLQSRFTDSFPDIIALKRDIANMQQQVADEKAKGSDNDDADKTQLSNPLYEQLKLRVVDADTVVASLKRQLETAQQDATRIDDAIKAAPGIELQLQNLDRDYDILKKNYQELVQRREAANLAQAADTQADKVQFRVVDAPQVPLTPAAPNRRILNSGVLVFGLGAGMGAAFLLVQLDRSFSNLSSLRSLGLPVLGSLSRVNFVDWRRRNFQQAAGLAASFVGLLLIYGILLIADLGLLHRII